MMTVTVIVVIALIVVVVVVADIIVNSDATTVFNSCSILNTLHDIVAVVVGGSINVGSSSSKMM